MHREAAIRELATAHAVALRMHFAGSSDEAIANALGIPTEAVASVLAIAHAKLDAIVAETEAAKATQTEVDA